jgi:transposase-like protein
MLPKFTKTWKKKVVIIKNKSYNCYTCGDEMIWIEGSLVCLGCGRTWTPSNNYTINSSYTDTYYDTYDTGWSDRDIERIQRENGLSDEDIANGAWIDF